MKYVVKDLVAVVVLYNTNASASKTLLALEANSTYMNEDLDVIVYDNSPNTIAHEFHGLKHLHISYFHDKSNPGVSKAYNFAAKEGARENKQFLLLLDQDTNLPSDSLSKYLVAVNTNNCKLFVPILKANNAVYSPAKYFFSRGVIWNDVQPGIHSLKNRTILNSGALVSIDAFLQAGQFNEAIQLYFSDFDFINRFRKIYHEFYVLDVICNHQLSDIENTDLKSAQNRFRYYSKGSLLSSTNTWLYICHFATVLLRAAKLSWNFKSLVFLRIFFSTYLNAGKAN
jgi:rhamnosyltransferase